MSRGQRVMDMNASDRLVIEKFAASDASKDPDHKLLREQAVRVYRSWLPYCSKEEWNRHMQFMSEVDSSSPDLGLRARYRAALLARENLPAIKVT